MKREFDKNEKDKKKRGGERDRFLKKYRKIARPNEKTIKTKKRFRGISVLNEKTHKIGR